MPKYRVWLTTPAEAAIEVEVPDSVTDPEDILDAAYEGDMPTLCAHCSGWNDSYSLGLGEAWEPVEEAGSSKPLIEKIKGEG